MGLVEYILSVELSWWGSDDDHHHHHRPGITDVASCRNDQHDILDDHPDQKVIA